MALFYTHWSKEEIRDCGLARENPAEPAQSLHEKESKRTGSGKGWLVILKKDSRYIFYDWCVFLKVESRSCFCRLHYKS